MQESPYYLDLTTFTLEKLKKLLKNSRLLPSQQILLENIDQHFAILGQNGIENLQQLQNALKTKPKVQSFAQETGLPVDFLTVLRREVNSYQPKPVNIKDFPGVAPDNVHKLAQVGVKNSKQLFPYVLTQKDRRMFAQQNQIAYEDILDLTKLTDVVRLKWVGPKFAALLTASSYDTVQKIAGSDYEKLYLTLVQVNEEQDIYRGKFGLEDLKLWVNVVVQDVPQVIQYE